jgi:pyruvate/2-oxoglutarate dehydrogenase complex dihydrolipoamide acyltransferase (E2) component
MKVLMPQLGETVTEGTVAGWRKQVGDKVAADEILLDIETDKVSMEVPAPQAGVLSKILVEAGQTVGVGTELAVIEAEGAQAVEEPTVRAPVLPARASTPPAASPAATETRAAAATPAASRKGASKAPSAERGDTQRLSPAVRRLVAEYQIDVQAVAGTGRNGRVTRRNIVDFLEHRGSAQAAPEAPPEPHAARPSPRRPLGHRRLPSPPRKWQQRPRPEGDRCR